MSLKGISTKLTTQELVALAFTSFILIGSLVSGVLIFLGFSYRTPCTQVPFIPFSDKPIPKGLDYCPIEVSDNNVIIRCEIEGQCIIPRRGEGAAVVISANNVKLSGFEMVDWETGVVVKGSRSFSVENNTIKSSKSNCIEITDSEDGFVAFNECIDHEGDGIALLNTHLTFLEENTAEFNTGSGFSLQDSMENDLLSNFALSNGVDIKLIGTSNRGNNNFDGNEYCNVEEDETLLRTSDPLGPFNTQSCL